MQLSKTAIYFGVELGTFYLVNDGSVVSFVYGKDISALRSFKLYLFYVLYGLIRLVFHHHTKVR